MGKKEPWNPLLKSYPNSQKINRVSEGAETLYARLIAQCDDGANYWGDPFLILSGLYKLRARKKKVTEKKVKARRDELVRERLICLYEVDGEIYIHINNCKKHLRRDIKPTIEYPEFTQTLVAKGDTESVTDAARTRNETVPTYSDSDTDTNSNTDSVISVLFNHWNSFKGQKNWKHHPKISYEIESAIREQLKHYSVEQLKKAIDNYAKVLSGKDYTWSYAWTFRQFLTRKQKPPNQHDLQLYRWLESGFQEDDYLKDSAQSRRAAERTRYYEGIRDMEQDKLIAAYRENKNNMNWLIEEIRPEIRELCNE